MFVSDGTIIVILWQSVDPDNATSIDRKNNISLHHLALRINKRLVDSGFQIFTAHFWLIFSK